MGRSVDYLSRAKRVTYIHRPEPDTFQIDGENYEGTEEEAREAYSKFMESGEEPEMTFEEYCEEYIYHHHEPDLFEWNMFMEYLTETLQELFPSLDTCKRWDGGETQIFLENKLVEIGISEYCGLVSVSVRPSERYDGDNIEGLAINWIDKVWDKVDAKLKDNGTTVIRKVGTFSNGEGVFEKA